MNPAADWSPSSPSAAAEAQRDLLAAAIRSQPQTAEAARRYAQRALGMRRSAPIDLTVEPYQTLGLLTTGEAARIAELTGIEAVRREPYDWAIGRYAPIHIRNEHGDEATEATRGQRAVMAEDYAMIPSILRAPDAMRIDADMIIIDKAIDAERFVLAFRAQKKRRMLALVSMWIHRRQAPR